MNDKAVTELINRRKPSHFFTIVDNAGGSDRQSMANNLLILAQLEGITSVILRRVEA